MRKLRPWMVEMVALKVINWLRPHGMAVFRRALPGLIFLIAVTPHAPATRPTGNPSGISNLQLQAGAAKSHSTAGSEHSGQKILAAYATMPLSFEANQGQTDSKVKFLSRGPGYNILLTSTEAVIRLRKPSGLEPLRGPHDLPTQARSEAAQDTGPAVVRMKLARGNPNPKVAGAEEIPSKTNYFLGRDPRNWHTNVSRYAKVRYEQVYPGVDIVYYGNQRQLEYDFVVAPGADPAAIELEFTGPERSEITSQGDLLLHVGREQVRFEKPVIYQAEQGMRREIAGGYVLRQSGHVSFEVLSYDPTQPLIIDPVLNYSTYLGGSSDDYEFGIAVDPAGNAYITGYTDSLDFPAVNGYDLSFGPPRDAFVAKLNPAAVGAASLVYSTYLGGSNYDFGYAIAVDNTGNAYVAGFTRSPDFPTTLNAYDTTLGGGGDAFVTKLNASGSALLYSTYLGGSGEEPAWAIALDSAGNAYVTGHTGSSDFPIVNGFDATFSGFQDAFVAKLDPALSGAASLLYSSYLGGSAGDQAGYGIAVDPAKNAWITGYTNASNFPTTPDGYDIIWNGSRDAFITKINPALAGAASLIYSTYLGGAVGDPSFGDAGYGVAVHSGNVYITGYTTSSDFPILNGYDTTFNGGFDVFVAKLNPNIAGTASLLYSTYLGGSGSDLGYGVAVDSGGNAYVCGFTTSSNFPTFNAYDAIPGGGADAFVAKLNPQLSGAASLVYSTYLGGNNSADYVQGTIALDSAGNVYVAGFTASSDFPIMNGYDSTINGFFDAFVVKLGADGTSTDNVGPATSNAVMAPNPVPKNTGSVLTATVDDSSTGGSNIASAEYNIDGGSFTPMSAADGAFDEVGEDVTATVAPFAVAGLHTLCVRGTDAAGNRGAAECSLLVVYDPSGGFVTGGGWVDSPAGADAANPSASGPATFGFNSKYLPGRSTPTGDLEFQFKAGSLNFKSTSMDWLVVTGEPRALFRGTGTINGTTVCKFEVDARDGSSQPGNVDAFGLKIFSCGGGSNRYSLAATPLTRGSIIIHKQ